MMMASVEKNLVRSQLKLRREALSQERRNEARHALTTSLYPQLKSFRNILSFHSFGIEIDTSLLNAHLAIEQKLLLPKVAGNSLFIFGVTDLQRQLSSSSYGKLAEPDPALCPQTDIEKIECVLVPGLGFDSQNRRIGYGKGHYDRLLAQLKDLASPPLTIGLGFREQFYQDALPYEAHDLAMDQVVLL